MPFHSLMRSITSRRNTLSAPPVLVLAKAKNYRERTRRTSPADRAALDRARVVWEGPVGGTTYVLLTNGDA